MEEPNELAKTIAATDPTGVKLDNAVKAFFAHKPLLSRVIKETVLECKDMTYEEIEACIEGDAQIDKVFVDPGLTNSGERLQGLNTELYLNEEGLIRFDLFTYLRIPESGKDSLIKVYLNLELMNEDTPGYDICLRALFYCCRMISMQHGTEFTTHKDDPIKYGNIKKVYSIWICTESAQKRANTIESYSISKDFLLGVNIDNPRYDIINATIIYISKNHDTGNTDSSLIRMLTDLFDETLPGIEKVKKLRNEHKIPMTRELGKEVPELCTYAEAMVLKGMEQERVNTERERANAEREKANAEKERANAEREKANAEKEKKRADEAEAQNKSLLEEIQVLKKQLGLI